MKKLVFLIFVGLLSNTWAHEQHAHQLITLEAYKLLKRSIGSDIPKMQSHLGSQIGFAGDRPWTTGLVLSGAWREDLEDVVYGYSNLTPPTVTGPGGVISDIVLFFTGLFNNSNEAYSSVTHFWEPDDGDNLNTTMEVQKLGDHYQFTVPNAYQKMKAYVNGNWGVSVDERFLYTNNNSDAYLSNTLGQTFQTFCYTNLIDLYKTGKVKIKNLAYAYYYLHKRDGSTIIILPSNGTITLTLNEDTKNKVVWEILGRMCHLLQDMTVPAHVHIDAHGNDDPGIKQDPYERSFGDIQWTADQVYYNVGGLFDINQMIDPIHTLMFTNAQISDHFAGAGPYSTRIDDLIEGNYTSAEYNYLTGLNLTSYGAPTVFTDINQISTAELTNMRDKLIPQAIRSTASLLYWFAKQAGILPVPLTGVGIWGPTEMYNQGNYYWNASITNGVEPITYQWEIYKIQMQQTRALPSGDWFSTGSNQSTLVLTPPNNGDTRDFKLRCRATDATGASFLSNEWPVDYIDAAPPINYNLEEGGVASASLIIPEVSTNYSLEQNYPNPFNPTTTISYSLPEAGMVTLNIYNMLGQEVACLVNEVKTAGTHKATFNANKLASGIYIYELRANNKVLKNKMNLIK